MASLEGAVQGSVSKKGVGSFTLPGLLKITAVSVPAKPRRKGINPFTKEEQLFAATPASVTVQLRPLQKLTDPASCSPHPRDASAAPPSPTNRPVCVSFGLSSPPFHSFPSFFFPFTFPTPPPPP